MNATTLSRNGTSPTGSTEPAEPVTADGGGLLRPLLTLFAVLSLLVGIAYPLAVTAIARVAFPQQAAGSIVLRDGQAVGSRLIGQNFADPGHFWSRPSATSPMPYNAAASGGSNQGPLNPALVDAVKARAQALRAADPGNTRPIPADLVTASASGLDPDISPAAARWQVERVARARKLPPQRVAALVEQHIERPVPAFLGPARVNVLALNLALDAMK